MPLPLPNLDDHEYADLVEMARSLIPSECPEWTDHNPSDTGIILIELLAWLTELLLYQTNQVPELSQREFLRLLKGNATWEKPTIQSWQTATQETIVALRKRYRAVTAQDYEALVLEDRSGSTTAEALAKQLTSERVTIGRVKAFANRNLTLNPQPKDPAWGHISLVVLPQNAEKQPVALSERLQKAIANLLEERRLLGTKHYVVGCSEVEVTVQAKLYLEVGRQPEDIQKKAMDRLTQFFHPLTGGEEQRGWPFGRAVYLSEIYQQFDQLEGVDYVTEVKLNGKQEPVVLQAHQLVKFAASTSQLTAIAAN
jgi:hypothetical protein